MNPNLTRGILFFMRTFGKLLPDYTFVKLEFLLFMNKRLNLEKPTTFNEKLQWLKLYFRKPELTTMVDKVEAKKYVASKIGPEYIIPTIHVWNNLNEIDLSMMPKQFVLKATNGGGGSGVIVCKNKDEIDIKQVKHKLKRALKFSPYDYFREWPYKDITHRIIAEEYIADKNGELIDYKFTCANGTAHNVMLCLDRSSGNTKFYFFDKNWNLLRINIRGKNAPNNFSLPKPPNIDKMFEIAAELSKNLPFARIDLYNVDGKIYFGEITFFPNSGFDKNLLPETDLSFGSLIQLPN